MNSQRRTTTKHFIYKAVFFAVAAFQIPLVSLSSPVVKRDALTVTDWQTFPMLIEATTSGPTKATSPNYDTAIYRIVGDSMEIDYVYYHDVSHNAGTDPGTGLYLFKLPSGYQFDTSKLNVSPDPNLASLLGSSQLINNRAAPWPYDATSIALNSFESQQVGCCGSFPSPFFKSR